ncbi:class I SAM-dependent methyltransferase [Candidatus Corynebacterium faecigallinarum]|uniref:class I SAM-dependent methyltransferase n=1 Tax=Candidatus Corynebacterium faecigallinarum TaxID=2838528 RepID=UPI003FCFC8C7
MNEDFYSANAEWYAALVAPWQESTAQALHALIGPVLGGDVVDIASGTGSALPVLRDLGAQRLFAVEPSRAMRASLMATVAGDPDLMRRTTIIPAPFPQASSDLPDRWAAAVMFNAIGHLADAERTILWRTLDERLVSGGRFVVSLQPPAEVTEIPWTDFGEIAVGEHSIRTRGHAEPIDETHVRWTMEWVLSDAGGTVLTTRTAQHPWRVLSRQILAEEAAQQGFDIVESAPDEPILAVQRP